jgi:hypothetical protein
MKKDIVTFFISGKREDCLNFFKQDATEFMVTFSTVSTLLTKGIAYRLYVTESYREAAMLGEYIYKMSIERHVLEQITLQGIVKKTSDLFPAIKITLLTKRKEEV